MGVSYSCCVPQGGLVSPSSARLADRRRYPPAHFRLTHMRYVLSYLHEQTPIRQARHPSARNRTGGRVGPQL